MEQRHDVEANIFALKRKRVDDMIGRRGHVDMTERHDLRPRCRTRSVKDQRHVGFLGKTCLRRRAGMFRLGLEREATGRCAVVGDQRQYRDAALFGDRTGRRIHAFEDDQRFGVQIRKIEGEFFPTVGWVQRGSGRAAGNGEKGGGHLRPVGQHDGNAVVSPDSHPVEIGGGALGQHP